jgi:secreted Zn-dependent insulinase-like peptidase
MTMSEDLSNLSNISNKIKHYIKKSGDIYTSINDTFSYRLVTLQNKLQIFFVQDPDSSFSSATMNVSVGSVENPKGLDGLAHFLEHMLFMGSDLYPGGSYFQNQVSRYGGMTNAYTDSNNTQYYFTASGNFNELLKIFSRFFISPSFDLTYVEKEVNAVDSEHNKNIGSDVWRIMNVNKIFMTNPLHNRFNTGNKNTLLGAVNNDPEILRKELIKFYEKHYSSDKMILYISHTKINDEFVKNISEMFEQVKLVQTLDSELNILNTDEIATVKELHDSYEIVKIKTTGEGDYLMIRVLIDGNGKYVNNLCIDSYDVLLHILGRYGRGSLYLLLFDLGLVTNCSVGIDESFKTNVLFEIQFKLTQEGFDHFEKILYITNSYLEHLTFVAEKSDSMFVEFTKEIYVLSLLRFKTQDKFDGFSLCQSMSDIHVESGVDLEYAMIYAFLYGNFQSINDHFKKALRTMRINNFKVTMTSSKFDSSNLPKIDVLYGTKYSYEIIKIDRKLLSVDKSHGTKNFWSNELLMTAIRKSGYEYPEKNKYIPYGLSSIDRGIKNDINRDIDSGIDSISIIDTISKDDDTFIPINSDSGNIYYAKKGNTFKTYSLCISLNIKLDSLIGRPKVTFNRPELTHKNTNKSCPSNSKTYFATYATMYTAMVLYIYYVKRNKTIENRMMSEANLSISVGLNKNLSINIIGYNYEEGIDNLFESVMNWYFSDTNDKLNPNIYNIVYNELMTKLQNYKYMSAYGMIEPEFYHMINAEHDVSVDDMIIALKDLSHDKINTIYDPDTFVKTIIENLSYGSVIGVMGGSITMKQINKIIRIIDTTIKPSTIGNSLESTRGNSLESIKNNDTCQNLVYDFEDSDLSKFVVKINENPHNKERAIGYGLFVGNPKEINGTNWEIIRPFSSLLETFITEKFSSTVRTEKQVGYIAMAKMCNVNEINNPYIFLLFISQSSKKNLRKIVENYVEENMMEDVSSMTEENFESLKESIINQLSQKPINIFDDCYDIMSALTKTFDLNDRINNSDNENKNLSDRFNRKKKMIDALNKTNREMFIQFVKNIHDNKIRSVIEINPLT